MVKIVERIGEIEKKFSPPKPQADPNLFASYLQAVDEKLNVPAIKRLASGNQGEDDFNATYEKGSIKQMLTETAQKYGVDKKLVLALANAESGYRPDVVSSAGAVGVMQLMPDTAKGLGVSNSFDARQNIDGGVRYLKQMLDMFGGDKSKALAAYNAGPGAVQKYGGIPPYSETQSYVKNILADINN